MRVVTGAERLVENPSLVEGSRWGLITNYTAVMPDLGLVSTELQRRSGRVAALLGPEHGLRGTAQAGLSEGGGVDPGTGLPTLDTYGLSEEELDSAIKGLKLDALVADIQDVGVRFYTYAWTVVDCMRSAARLGLPFYVLDRPNPLSGLLQEGPGVGPDEKSFVGRLNIPIRHALTLGELLREASARDAVEGRPSLTPEVIAMQGWKRDMYWADTGLPWVMPSPNLPTPDSALAYAGTALFEGTNLSEGRGTTRPFELIGAPWMSERWAEELNQRELPGVRFRSTWFSPTFQKHRGETLCGVQLHVFDRSVFQPVRTGVEMLFSAQRLAPESFEWRLPEWETGPRSRPFIDLLWGSRSLREGLPDAGVEGVFAEAAESQGYLAEALYV